MIPFPLPPDDQLNDIGKYVVILVGSLLGLGFLIAYVSDVLK